MTRETRAASRRRRGKSNSGRKPSLITAIRPCRNFVEPPIGPVARPDLAASFPLILTCAKPSLFCQTQHRALPSLRKRALDPEVELNPATALARGIRNGDWVDVRTPAGGMRAGARFSDNLDPRVVVREHGCD